MNSPPKLIQIKQRKVCYREYGDPNGIPVFYLHGWPGSSLEAALVAQDDLRIIAVERPGFGLSDPNPQHSLLGYSDDLALMADALGIATFGLLGYSGGCPFALASAYKHPKRLSAVVIVSPQSPPNTPDIFTGISSQHRLSAQLAQYVPFVLEWALNNMAVGLHHAMTSAQSRPQNMVASSADIELFRQQPELRRLLLQSTIRALEQGTKHAVRERRILTQPWGFDPAEIQIPVHVWQGLEDINVSPSATRHLAQSIPKSQAHFLENEGHVSTLVRHLYSITTPFFGAKRGKL